MSDKDNDYFRNLLERDGLWPAIVAIEAALVPPWGDVGIPGEFDELLARLNRGLAHYGVPYRVVRAETP